MVRMVGKTDGQVLNPQSLVVVLKQCRPTRQDQANIQGLCPCNILVALAFSWYAHPVSYEWEAI